jgi:hypothetical protein
MTSKTQIVTESGVEIDVPLIKLTSISSPVASRSMSTGFISSPTSSTPTPTPS